MAIKIKEIIKYLETIAPQALQESYDNAGLITGDAEAEATGAMVCLDSTEAVIDEAIAKGCNLIIAHHPIIFTGLKKITGKNYIEKTIIKAIKNDIAIFAIHTNLDHVQDGVNKKFAEKLGLKNLKILSPKKQILKKIHVFVPDDHAHTVRMALFDAGAGHIGNYNECSFNLAGTGTFKAMPGADPFVGKVGEQHQEPEVKIETIYPAYLESKILQALIAVHPYEEVAYDIVPLDNILENTGAGMIGEIENEMDEMEFLNLIKKQMKSMCVRYSELLGKKVKKIAICGGSGSFLLNEAIKAGADVFVTADFKYHQFFDANNKIVIADIGHYESEQFTIDLLHDVLTKKFSNFAVFFTNVNTNPIKYI